MLRNDTSLTGLRTTILMALLVAFAVLAGCQPEAVKKQSASDSCQGRTGELVDEGSPEAPVTVGINAPHCGTVSAYGISYYRFTAQDDTEHRIALTDVESDLSWSLFVYEPPYPMVDSCDESYDAVDEMCRTPALESGTIYALRVDEWDYESGRFQLTVYDH